MTDERRRGSETPVDERTLDEALGRYLGSAVGEILKITVLQKAQPQGAKSPEVVLDQVEDVNAWLGRLLRRTVTGSEKGEGEGLRTQTSTNEPKGEK